MVTIQHKLHLTMVDGKVVSALSGMPTSNCTVCGAKPSELNDIVAARSRPVRTDGYEYGMSTLHAWIRIFECVLHLSYKLEVRKWQARSAEDKKAVQAKKAEIQRRFRDEMGLVVDMPKAGGSGTTNDGNTARRAFRDVNKLSQVTGVDRYLLNKFSIILSALASTTAEIDEVKYGEFTMETAQLYNERYYWYCMPPTLHKLLAHGQAIISTLEMPVGMYSEEAQEARNKNTRDYRQHHARKTSRLETMTDQLHYLLVTSDPVISEIIRSDITRARRQLKPREAAGDYVDISPLLMSSGTEAGDEDA